MTQSILCLEDLIPSLLMISQKKKARPRLCLMRIYKSKGSSSLC